MQGAGSLDISRLPCLEQARQLYQAYFAVLTGKQRVQVRHGEYWVEYRPSAPGDIKKLEDLYETIRAGCPQAQCELPSLQRACVGRGGPLRGYV
jgi:hypothetical protein